MFILKGYEIGFSIRVQFGLVISILGFAYGFDQNHARIWQIMLPQARQKRLNVVAYCVTVVCKSLYVMPFFVVILQSLNHDTIHVCRKNYIRLEKKAV